MPLASSEVEWAEVGNLVDQPELRQVLLRLEEDGIVKLSYGKLSLHLNVIPKAERRNDFLSFLKNARLRSDCAEHCFKDEEIEKDCVRPLLDDTMAGSSLSEIYQNIPSPPALEALQPEGVTTKMFQYQLRTLHRMLERETNPELVHSEGFIPIHCAAEILRLDPVTLRIRRHHSGLFSTSDARGGILSEEMGVGKTLEILSLILSTRGLLPSASVEEEEIASPVTTEIALQWPQKEWHGLDPISKDSLSLERIPYYPSHVEERGRPVQQVERYERSKSSERLPLATVKIPSLRSICAHVVRMAGLSIAPEQYLDEDSRFQMMAMEPLLKSATPFFHLWPPLRGHRTPRVEVERIPVKIYLSTATLVVVPGTLLAQWQAEIAKHTSQGALRVLYLPHANSSIPSALDLANEYDLILLSHARLGKEDKEGALEWRWPSVPRECRCPYLGSTRTVDCRCPPTQTYEPSEHMSSLLRCKFKRLCVDEGHVAAGDSDMVRMASKIRSECRWIISGTPTESLVGSNLYRDINSSSSRRGITNIERKDLEKLRALLHDFLKVPLLRNWHAEYETPFKRGSLYASTRLWKLLSRVMVRNQPQDVEKNSPLPPLRDEVVRLDFTRLERITFNVLQSLILLNAVWSQREDDDYFFHHSNRKHLAVIMENLSLSCFHFAGPTLFEQSKEALTHATKQLAKKDKWNEIDRRQAHQAIQHLQEALDDEAWVNRGGDVVFKTENLDANVVRAWSRQGIDRELQLSAEEVMAMQRAMRSILEQQVNGSLEEGELGRVEELITMGELDKRLFYERQAKEQQSKEKKLKARSGEEPLSQVPTIASPVTSPSKKASRPKKKVKVGLLEYTQHEYEARERLPDDSDLRYAHLKGASSTKLVKMLEVLSRVPKDEKVIIFSNVDNVLYEASTALDIAWLPHFIYASGSNQERRNEVISAFRSEQTLVRILLMKTNIGGRGLDLSCANHAIFLEPILDKSLRVQALKRTWRTGQQRPVHATTFVMKETFEEDVLRISETTASTYKLSEDPSMRAVVSHPTFASSATLDVDRRISPPVFLFPTFKREEKHTIPLPTPPISPFKPWSTKEEATSTELLPSQYSTKRPLSPSHTHSNTKRRHVMFA